MGALIRFVGVALFSTLALTVDTPPVKAHSDRHPGLSPTAIRVAFESNASGKKVLSLDALDQVTLPDKAGQPAPSKEMPSEKAAALNQQAKRLIKNGHYTDTDKALSILEQAMTADPGYVDTYYHLGHVYLDRQDFRQAAENFQTVISQNEKSPPSEPRRLATSLFYLGIARYHLKDYAGAVAAFQQATKIRRDLPDDTAPTMKEILENLDKAAGHLASDQTPVSKD